MCTQSLVRNSKDRVYGEWKYKVSKSTANYFGAENNNEINSDDFVFGVNIQSS